MKINISNAQSLIGSALFNKKLTIKELKELFVNDGEVNIEEVVNKMLDLQHLYTSDNGHDGLLKRVFYHCNASYILRLQQEGNNVYIGLLGRKRLHEIYEIELDEKTERVFKEEARYWVNGHDYFGFYENGNLSVYVDNFPGPKKMFLSSLPIRTLRDLEYNLKQCGLEMKFRKL